MEEIMQKKKKIYTIIFGILAKGRQQRKAAWRMSRLRTHHDRDAEHYDEV